MSWHDRSGAPRTGATKALTMALIVMVAAWTGPLLAPALADTPRTMDFQAFVTEDDDNNPQTPEVPVEGIRDITFTIWRDSTSTEPQHNVWMEHHPGVPIEAGRLHVVLGVYVPLTDLVFVGPSRYLEYWDLQDPSPAAPRLRISSVPFANRVSTLDRATAGEVSGTLTLIAPDDAPVVSIDAYDIEPDFRSVFVGRFSVHGRYGADHTTIEMVGGGTHGATVRLYDDDGNRAIVAYADVAGLGGEPQLYLYRSDEQDLPVIKLSANSSGGYITLRDDSVPDPESTIVLNGNIGRVKAKVVQITGGMDFAENFDVVDRGTPIRPGTVLAIDERSAGRLAVCAEAYDRKVAGVISGAGGIDSGMVMGESESFERGDHPVALSGRVYCLADASAAPIRLGDLLVSSATPGHAMRAVDPVRARGAILGKAMSSLEAGRGLVLVLVTLQ